MICLYCSATTNITNSRSFRGGFEKWRRHKCQSCDAVFTTRELPDLEVSLRVVKRAGPREKFQLGKIIISIYKAIDHRNSAASDALTLSQTICTQLLPCHDGMVSTDFISETAIKTLKNFDPVGAVKYQAARSPQMNKRDVRRAIK